MCELRLSGILQRYSLRRRSSLENCIACERVEEEERLSEDGLCEGCYGDGITSHAMYLALYYVPTNKEE